MICGIYRRLAALEAGHCVRRPKYVLWVDEGDGYMRNKEGTTMTREAFEAAVPKPIKIRLSIFGDLARRIPGAKP